MKDIYGRAYREPSLTVPRVSAALRAAYERERRIDAILETLDPIGTTWYKKYEESRAEVEAQMAAEAITAAELEADGGGCRHAV